MTNEFTNPRDFEPTREDVLIGRVVDGEASSTDWDALETIAKTDSAVWERLGRAQRIHARLEREVDDAIAIAELIDVPPTSAIAITSFRDRIRQYSGWAAAAAIAVAWLGLNGWSPVIPGTYTGQTNRASLGALPKELLHQASPDDLLDQYVRSGMAQGRVLGEMPVMLVDSKDLGEGRGKEVWFLRPILERTTVTDVLPVSVQKDEHGMPRYVPIQIQPARNSDGGAL